MAVRQLSRLLDDRRARRAGAIVVGVDGADEDVDAGRPTDLRRVTEVRRLRLTGVDPSAPSRDARRRPPLVSEADEGNDLGAGTLALVCGPAALATNPPGTR